ncbi:hypothetical protein JZO70_09515 [Enterococcus sp. 669A]|uniref:Uncharacterized protein n=1 Tax=Candidatus Enterococcus moelleringii TaxID=2815325 RepID=A0ABS3L9T8_9ENTE|nr:hypothetical protein [Enterococcus sp. 669A]MBO1306398.1 hypothetical protein [Enterococcus sp. 669A]
MKEYSTPVRILMVIGFFLVASLALHIVGPLISGLLSVVFRVGVPLAIAYFIVNWLTKRSQQRRY